MCREATYIDEKESPSSSVPCAPPPSPVTGCRRTFGFAVPSSSPELHESQDYVDMSDSLVVALSRMTVEQSTLKRKKHSEHDLPPQFELAEVSGRSHEQKRVKSHCNKKRAINSVLNSSKLFQDLVPVGSVKSSIPVPST